MIKVNISRLFRLLVIVFVVLFTIHVVFYVLHTVFFHLSGEETSISSTKELLFFKLKELFDMNQEQNLPTLYNTFIALVSSLLLALIASNEGKKRDKWLWGGMALIFLYIGVDDFVTIHEGIFHNFMPEYSGTGFLKYGWVIPFGVIMVVVLIVYIPHVFRIPKKVRNKMIVAGAVYVTGGYVLEMVGGYFTDHGHYLLFIIAVTLEEAGEMIGLLLFINSLIHYISLRNSSISIPLSSYNGRHERNGVEKTTREKTLVAENHH